MKNITKTTQTIKVSTEVEEISKLTKEAEKTSKLVKETETTLGATIIESVKAAEQAGEEAKVVSGIDRAKDTLERLKKWEEPGVDELKITKTGETGKIASNVIKGNSYDINKLVKTQSYTYPENVSSLVETISKNGPNFVPPITVLVYKDQALVVDGHNRLEAFKRLGYKRVPIKYIHRSQLGKNLPDGNRYRELEELLDSVIKN